MPAVTELASAQVPYPEDVRGVLRYADFRRLYFALALSSLGDWLGLFATQAIAKDLTRTTSGAAFAIGGVLIFRLLPAVVLGPFAGVFADRFDRRKTMVVCDVMRFAIFVSIPLVRSIPYLLVASFVVEAISLFWIPAKEASVPNLLPPNKLEPANQISLITTYGMAPVAAGIFTGLGAVNLLLGKVFPAFETRPTDLALYFDGATFLFSAFTVSRLRTLRGQRRAGKTDVADSAAAEPAARPHALARLRDFGRQTFASLGEGWRFIQQTQLIRGLVVGILGAFASGGVVVALAPLFVDRLHGGNAGIGLLFVAVFTGLALGMAVGPKLLRGFSRRRLFGLCIVGAGLSLSLSALVLNLVLALLLTSLVGAFAGVAWVTGYTLLGAEVEDEMRGRTFASVQSLVRVDLLLTLAVAPMISGTVDSVLGERVTAQLNGVTITVFVAGLVAIVVGLLSYRQMVEPGTPPLWRDLVDHLPMIGRRPPRLPGLFVAFEGGEGVGKSTQARLLAEWLDAQGYDVVVTFEPGGTEPGQAIRSLLLDGRTEGLTPRAEALLYAADRADHVARVVRPALERGAVVITDRYIDSSLAYQGGGRQLEVDEVAALSRWATGHVTPDVTVLLDLDPVTGLRRAGSAPDRIEAESVEFHRRVRATFRTLAEKERYRYAVIDAGGSVDEVQHAVRAAVERVLRVRLDIAPAGGADHERVGAQ